MPHPLELMYMARVVHNISVAGTTGVGKSVMIFHMAKALVAQGATAHLQAASGERRGVATESDSVARIANMMDSGYWPKASEVGMLERLQIDYGRDGEEHEIRFFDPAGEVFENIHTSYSGTDSKRDSDRQQIARELVDSDGLMFLLDVRTDPKLIFKQVEDFIALLKSNWKVRDDSKGPLIANSRIQVPIAILFTKAETLPWQSLYRQTRAEKWMETNPSLKGVREMVLGKQVAKGRLKGGAFADARFYFSSSIGWTNGQPNCRTLLIPPQIGPRENTVEAFKDASVDLLPNPARTPRAAPRGHGRGADYTFIADPTRITRTSSEIDALEALGLVSVKRPTESIYGVYEAPNRNAKANSSNDETVTRPWNVAEPLLYVTGLEEPSK